MARIGAARIGCSGWEDTHWRGDFYPATIPRTRWFERYAAAFDTVEINNTFYRLPETHTFAAWAERAPAGFLYAVKASRFLTHMKKLKEPEEPLDRLFSRMRPLGRQLGPVLYQLPPSWKLDRDRLEHFLQALPPRVRHVIEFRDPSWYADGLAEMLERYGVDRLLTTHRRRAFAPFQAQRSIGWIRRRCKHGSLVGVILRGSRRTQHVRCDGSGGTHMNAQQKFLLGAAVGAAAVLAGSRVVRRRHAIDFAGRVVVITGGSRGLGLVIARRLAAEGARLCLLARDEAELDRARAHFTDNTEVLTLRCDVRRRADVRAAVDAILDRWPAIDVLINNAGVIQVGPLEHMTTEDFENAMATHFWGPLHLMYEAVPSMRRRGFGRIVNISSIGGRIAVPHLAPYCASKFALVGLSDAVRAELDQYGIRVTTATPGLMRTGGAVNADMKGHHDLEYAWFAIADSLPGLSTGAESAASRIIDACRHGDPELTLTLPAKIAMVANSLAPAAVARAMMLANRILPPANGMGGDRRRRGAASTSKWAPSIATVLSDRAAVMNNEV